MNAEEDIVEILFDSLVCEDFHRRKEEFSVALQADFKDIIQSAEEKSEFQWKFVENYYHNLKHAPRKVYELLLFCDFLFGLFAKFHCCNTEFMFKIIKLYKQVVNKYQTLEMCYCSRRRMLCDCSKPVMKSGHFVNEDNVTVTIEDPEENFTFPNRDLFRQMTFYGISVGNLTLIKFLNKYGLISFLDETDVHLQVKDKLQELYSLSTRQLNGIEVDALRDEFVQDLLEQFSTKEEKNLRRLTIIVMAVNFSLEIFLTRAFYLYDWSPIVECINFYNMSLPEAKITTKEVRDFVELVLKNELLVEEAFTSFMKVFPDTPSHSSPRLLKHLCRYKVRQYLKKPLTITLSEMRMANPIKNFLLYSSD